MRLVVRQSHVRDWVQHWTVDASTKQQYTCAVRNRRNTQCIFEFLRKFVCHNHGEFQVVSAITVSQDVVMEDQQILGKYRPSATGALRTTKVGTFKVVCDFLNCGVEIVLWNYSLKGVLKVIVSYQGRAGMHFTYTTNSASVYYITSRRRPWHQTDWPRWKKQLEQSILVNAASKAFIAASTRSVIMRRRFRLGCMDVLQQLGRHSRLPGFCLEADSRPCSCGYAGVGKPSRRAYILLFPVISWLRHHH